MGLLICLVCALHVNTLGILGQESNDLGSFLSHYEVLSASDIHRIEKRSLENTSVEIIHFDAFNKSFDLHLEPNTGLLSDDFKMVVINGSGVETETAIPSRIPLEGYLEGEAETSEVHALWGEDNTLTATILMGNETYHLEPAWMVNAYIGGNRSLNGTVAFRGTDLNMTYDLGSSFCNGTQHSDTQHSGTQHSGTHRRSLTLAERMKRMYKPGHRKRRSARKSACTLLLVADHRFFKNIANSDESKAYNYMVSVIDIVDVIFRKTAFGSEEYTDLGFEIKEIIIHDEPSYQNIFGYNSDQEMTGAELLDNFSLNPSHGDFCLAHLFTHANYGAQLGLGFVAQLMKPGGICSELNRDLQSRYWYLNTAWSNTLLNDGRLMLPAETAIVTAHELGHNWGAHHDPEGECTPPDYKGGEYLMSATSTSGGERNNQLFSPCSIKSIKSILDERHGECFVAWSRSKLPICGNNILELGEECDSDVCCDGNCRAMVPDKEGKCRESIDSLITKYIQNNQKSIAMAIGFCLAAILIAVCIIKCRFFPIKKNPDKPAIEERAP